MRNGSLLLALGLCLAVGAQAQTEKTKPAADQTRIEELINQLGSSSFAERKRAMEGLEAIGVPALPAMRKAAQSAEILETKRRCEEIVRKLEEKATRQAMLAPKIVRLKFKDLPVLDAVAELAKQSGYILQVVGDRTVLADRKVTLDTGDTSFWEAFDQLCLKAGLVENLTVAQPPQQPEIRPAIQFQPIPKLQIPPKAVPGILPVPAPPKPLPGKPGKIIPLGLQAQAQPAANGQPGAPGQPAIQAAQKVQIQARQMAVQNFQVQPGFGGNGGQPQPTGNQIQLSDGKPKEGPTSYSGAIRIRVASTEVKNGEAIITLDVACEPRLQDFQLVAAPRIDKALDDRGQALLMAMEQPNQANNPLANGNINMLQGGLSSGPQRRIPIRLKLGEKESKNLKELSGSLNAQALTQTEALVTVDNILKAAGTTVKGKNGGVVQVHSIDKQNGGDYVVKVTLENMPGNVNPFGGGGNIMIRGGGVVRIQINGGNVVINNMGMGGNNNSNFPKLVDAKGVPYQFGGVTNSTFQFNGGQSSQTLTLVYRPQANQGDPSQLIQYGQRRVDFQVPFSLKNVSLK